MGALLEIDRLVCVIPDPLTRQSDSGSRAELKSSSSKGSKHPKLSNSIVIFRAMLGGFPAGNIFYICTHTAYIAAFSGFPSRKQNCNFRPKEGGGA